MCLKCIQLLIDSVACTVTKDLNVDTLRRASLHTGACHSAASLHRAPARQHAVSSADSLRRLQPLAQMFTAPADARCASAGDMQAGMQPYTTAARPCGAVVLDGRLVRDEWLEEMRAQVAEVTAALNRSPGLCVILVGDRPDSRLYVARKEEACRLMDIKCEVMRLPASVSQDKLQAAVEGACSNAHVDGVLVQLPLPPHLDEEHIIERIDARKDVDGFHPLNMGRVLARDIPPRFVPATALGCTELLERFSIPVTGKHVVILGDSNIVGTPLSMLLRDTGAGTVTVCHRMSYADLFRDRSSRHCSNARAQSAACLPRLPGPQSVRPRGPRSYLRQQVARDGAAAKVHVHEDGESQHTAHTVLAANTVMSPSVGGVTSKPAEAASEESHSNSSGVAGLKQLTRTADILVVAVGIPELIKMDWVKAGAVVLDVGINVVPVKHNSSEMCTLASVEETVGRDGEEQLKVVGDVDYDQVRSVASAITPVPGGVGPVTIAALVHNIILAARYQAGLVPW